MRPQLLIALALVPLCASLIRCSLSPASPMVTLTVRADRSAQTTGSSRPGRSPTNASLSAASYTTAVPDLTPSCPPAAFTCEGTTACDRFNGTDGDSLLSHMMDVGSGWIANNLIAPKLKNGGVEITPATPGSRSQIYTPVTSRDMVVRGSVTLGFPTVNAEAGLLARYYDNANYVFGGLHRESETLYCSLELVEVIGGIDYLRSTAPVPPARCNNSSHPLVLRAFGDFYKLTFDGFVADYNSASTTLIGTSGGAGSAFNGTMTGNQILDDFSGAPSPLP